MFVKGSVEDFIYILIGILWIAFSIYKGVKGSQKKRSQPVTADETDQQDPAESSGSRKTGKSVFDAFLEEITREEESVPYTPAKPTIMKEKPLSPEKKVTPKKPFSYDDIYEESNYLDKSGVYELRTATKPTKQEELATYLQNRKRPRIDLKKAVIYSEILNRRYF